MQDEVNMGTVRIISGRYRGRKLTVLDEVGLRPTTDRVRETVFNWLQFKLLGTKCLDLFAGSGALGFEAASRGAQNVMMMDINANAIANLEKNVKLLAAENIKVFRCDAAVLVSNPCRCGPFDIIFLDPPYHCNLLSSVACGLTANGFLKNESLIYVEHGADEDPQLPSSWELLKSQGAGQCWYGLYKFLDGVVS